MALFCFATGAQAGPGSAKSKLGGTYQKLNDLNLGIKKPQVEDKKDLLKQDADSIKFENKEVRSFKMSPEVSVERKDFFLRYKESLKLDENYQMKEHVVFPMKGPALGYTLSRDKETYKGYEVEGAQFILHEKDNRVVSGSSNLVTGLNIDTSNPMEESDALDFVMAAITDKRFTFDTEFNEGQQSKGRLLIAPKIFEGKLGDYCFVWRFEIPTINPKDNFIVDINAKTGELVNMYSTRQYYSFEFNENVKGKALLRPDGGEQDIITDKGKDGKYRLASQMQYDESLKRWTVEAPSVTFDNRPGSPEHVFADNNHNDNYWDDAGDEPGIHAFTVLSWVMDYFQCGPFSSVSSFSQCQDNFGWLGMDGMGGKKEGPIYVIIEKNLQGGGYWGGPISGGYTHYSFFGLGLNPSEILYLDSDSMSNWSWKNKIVGHEFTHGVEHHVTGGGLFRFSEANAISEGFAELFGYLTANNIENRRTGTSNDYLISAMRVSPDTYGGVDFLPIKGVCTIDNDWCHTDGRILLNWFYILAKGSEMTNDLGNRYKVTGIGTEKASWIAFITLLNLAQSDDFKKVREKSIAAAEMFGTAMPEVVKAVTDAWYAVGVGEEYQARTYCPSEGATNVEPWPTIIKWEVFPDEGNWKICLAEDGSAKWQWDCTGAISLSSDVDTHKTSASVKFNLKPNTTYHWKFITQKTLSVLDTPQGTAQTTHGQTNSSQSSFISWVSSGLKSTFSGFFERLGLQFHSTHGLLDIDKSQPFNPGNSGRKNQIPPGDELGNQPGMDNSKLFNPEGVTEGQDGWGKWSAWHQFTTDAQKPKLIDAAQAVNPWNAELKLEKVGGADSYVLEVAEDPNFVYVVVDGYGLNPHDPQNIISDKELKATFNNFETDKNYFWHARAIKHIEEGTLEGEWSNLAAFHTNIPETSIVTPPNGFFQSFFKVILKWQPVKGAAGYAVVVSKNPDLSSPENIGPSPVGENSTSLPVVLNTANQAGETVYYWSVQPYGPPPLSQKGKATPVSSFYVRKSLSKPMIISPNGVEVPYGEASTSFHWDSILGADDYILRVSGGGQERLFIVAKQSGTMTYPVPNVSTDPNGYQWYVIARKGNIMGVASDVARYTVGAAPVEVVSPVNGQNINTCGVLSYVWKSPHAPHGYSLGLIDPQQGTSQPFYRSIDGTSLAIDYSSEFTYLVCPPRGSCERRSRPSLQLSWMVATLNADGSFAYQTDWQTITLNKADCSGEGKQFGPDEGNKSGNNGENNGSSDCTAPTNNGQAPWGGVIMTEPEMGKYYTAPEPAWAKWNRVSDATIYRVTISTWNCPLESMNPQPIRVVPVDVPQTPADPVVFPLNHSAGYVYTINVQAGKQCQNGDIKWNPLSDGRMYSTIGGKCQP